MVGETKFVLLFLNYKKIRLDDSHTNDVKLLLEKNLKNNLSPLN